jgi:hypothetical protein
MIDQGTEANLWGPLLDAGFFEMLEDGIAGQVDVDVTAGNVTLSSNNYAVDQARMAILKITGSPGVPRTVTVPATSKIYLVNNALTTVQTVTVTNGVASTNVTQGETLLLFSDNPVPNTLPVQGVLRAQSSPAFGAIATGATSAALTLPIIGASAGAFNTPFRYFLQGDWVIATISGHTTTINPATTWSYDLDAALFPVGYRPISPVSYRGVVIENAIEVPCAVSVSLGGAMTFTKSNNTVWTAGVSKTLPFDWTFAWNSI